MIYNENLYGRMITLKPVMIDDAEYILSVRQDKEKTKYLHSVENSLEKQKEWIKVHQEMPNDYYFLIVDKEDKKLGTVGLCNIKGECGEVGRLVSYGNAIQNVEANMLITDFAFNVMKLKQLKGSICSQNKEVISLQKKFGYDIEEKVSIVDDLELRFAELTVQRYYEHRTKILELINKCSN